MHASLVQCQRAIATIQKAFDEATGYQLLARSRDRCAACWHS